ncbi:MAG TPA: FAD-dependent oxidoreductase [Solirubrobacteraceae bacterium]|nr:FAD-dependent oxidoreductase [Solirubrobacteraceae bacterium]
MSEKRILIVGGGFAGVHAAAGAAATLRGRRDDIRVELVSPDPYLTIRPRLYESDLSGARIPLEGLLAPIGVAYRRSSVLRIDAAGRTASIEGEPDPVAYGQLVLAAGSSVTTPAGRNVHAVDDYARAAEFHRTLRERGTRDRGTIIVGAGFTGVELAAEIAGDEHVTLLESQDRIAPEFGPRARAVIGSALESLGVQTRVGVAVRDVTADGVRLDDGSLVAGDLVVWAAGPRPSPLAGQIGAPLDRLGRLRVDATLSSGVGAVWAAGDVAAAPVDGSHDAVMSCQHAMPQGRRAGENAARAALGAPARAYTQPLYLTCLDLGAHGALLTCGFDRDTVLATGAHAKDFKRYINRSVIYPPHSSNTDALLAIGRPGPVGPAGARLTRLALRSGHLRRRVTAGAEDRASLFADTEGDLESVA